MRELGEVCAVTGTVRHLLGYLQHPATSTAGSLRVCVFCVLVFCDTKSLISIVEFPDHTILVSTSV